MFGFFKKEQKPTVSLDENGLPIPERVNVSLDRFLAKELEQLSHRVGSSTVYQSQIDRRRNEIVDHVMYRYLASRWVSREKFDKHLRDMRARWYREVTHTGWMDDESSE